MDNVAAASLFFNHTLHAANLTRGRGGIGATYSDEDWVRVLLHGVRKDGRSVVFMPSHDFRFTRRDMGDIIAYFRSVPPVEAARQTFAHRLGRAVARSRWLLLRHTESGL